MNLYVLPDGKIEAGSPQTTIKACLDKARIANLPFETICVISEGGSIQQVAKVKKD